MLELGDESEKEHREILALAKSLHFNEIITVGKHFKKVNVHGQSYETSQELSQALEKNKIQSENILLKASRGIALEKVLDFIV